MSNEALNAVWEHSQSHGVARLVLLSIADRADASGYAWCGANDLCERTRAARSSVFAALQWLVANGELRIHENKGPGGCNRYEVPVLKKHDRGDGRPDSEQSSPNTGLSSPMAGRGSSPIAGPGSPITGLGESDNRTSGSPEIGPKPSCNPPGTPKREEPLPLAEAVRLFEAEFPDRPIRASLSDLIQKKGRTALTPAYARKWLTAEIRRRPVPRPSMEPTPPFRPRDLPEADEPEEESFAIGPEAARAIAQMKAAAGLVRSGSAPPI